MSNLRTLVIPRTFLWCFLPLVISPAFSEKPSPNPAMNLQLPGSNQHCFPRRSQKLWVMEIRPPSPSIHLPDLKPELNPELKPQNSGLWVIHHSFCYPHRNSHNQNDHLSLPTSFYSLDHLKKSSFSEESNHSSSQNHPPHVCSMGQEAGYISFLAIQSPSLL